MDLTAGYVFRDRMMIGGSRWVQIECRCYGIFNFDVIILRQEAGIYVKTI